LSFYTNQDRGFSGIELRMAILVVGWLAIRVNLRLNLFI